MDRGEENQKICGESGGEVVRFLKSLKSLKAFKSFLDERRYAPFIGYAGLNPAYKVKVKIKVKVNIKIF